MKNGKKLWVIVLVVFIVMLIPIREEFWDGGSIQYRALLYKVTKVHRLSNQSSTGYEDGWKVEILGMQVYNVVGVVVDTLPEADTVINDNGIELIVKDETITRNGAVFIINNNTDKTLNYGCDYELQFKRNDKWYKFNVELNFNGIGYELKSHESKELDINWKESYSSLKIGEYRLLKKVTFDGDKTSFYIAKEFMVK